jgi:methylisocitrate lyase
LLAKRAGFKAIYLSGGGVAAGSLGLPDLGISNLDDVLTDVRRITDVCDLPLLVDVDTGFGASAFNVARTVKSMIKFGAAAMHIEDQVGAKRCGHRPGKEIVTSRKWSTASSRRRCARTDETSSSWPAPMRWPSKAWTPPSSAPWPAWKPAPT